MKKLNTLTLFVWFVTVLFTSLTQAQTKDKLPVGSGAANPVDTQARGDNIITQAEYDAITYNGYTIKQINATNGTFENLWGAPTKTKDSGHGYYYSTNYIFYDTEVKGYENVFRIEINNSTWPVRIKGQTVKVGDTFDSLKQKFGQNLKIFYNSQRNAVEYIVGFAKPNNDWDAMSIYFDKTTNKIIRIVYFVLP